MVRISGTAGGLNPRMVAMIIENSASDRRPFAHGLIALGDAPVHPVFQQIVERAQRLDLYRVLGDHLAQIVQFPVRVHPGCP